METVTNKKIPGTRWWRIIPVCILVYFGAFIDRSVISYSLAGGMSQHLALTASTIGLVTGVFSIGQLFLQVKGADLAKKGKSKRFITWTIVAWGLISLLTGFVKDGTQLLILRFLLGVAEGGLYPVILVIISNWFPNEERGKANSFFFTTSGVSQIVMGPLAGWILATFGWRDMYIVLGIISLVLVFVWMPIIAERPEDAKWLSKEEKDYILTKLSEEQEEIKKQNSIKELSYKKIPLRIILSDINVWKLILINLCAGAGIFGFGMWMPTLIGQLTKSGIQNIGYLSMVPNLMVVIGLWVWNYIGDKTKNRKLTAGLPLAGFGLFLISGTFVHNNVWLSYTLVCFAAFFLQGYLSGFYALAPMMFPSNTAGAIQGCITTSGSLGGFIGPYLVGIVTGLAGGNTASGFVALGIVLVIGYLISLTLPANTSKSLINDQSALEI